MDLGGGTKYRNDILLDGTPLIAGNKLGYTPPMDAVTEYTVVQNSSTPNLATARAASV
jgi:hypothetical protein